MTSPFPARSARTDAAQPLSVFADLRLETAGQRVVLVGDGQSLVLHTNNPRALLTAAGRASSASGFGGSAGRRAVGRTAGLLTQAGVRMDVRGPNGVLVSLGDGVESRIGGLLTGSRSVELGPAREVAGALTGGLRLGRAAVGAAALAVLAVGLLVVRHRVR